MLFNNQQTMNTSTIEERFEFGNIWHSNIFIPEIGHGKFFVTLGAINDIVYGFFYINSKINFNVNRHMEQAFLQIPISNTDYSFLTKETSYISCARIEELNKTKLIESISRGETQWKAKLKQEHIDIICQKVNKSSLYSRRIKRQLFGYV